MLKQIIASFLKIGFIGFGGGSALIPITEAEVCEEHHYLTKKEFTEHTVIANITPGALPVKLGALCGEQMSGTAGMLIGAWVVAFPGVFMTLMLLLMMSLLSGAVKQIEYASVGISVVIIFILIHYIRKVMKEAAAKHYLPLAIALTTSTIVLGGGKEFRTLISQLTGLEPATPWLDLSTIHLLMLVFFFIFFTGGQMVRHRTIPAFILMVIGIAVSGKRPLIPLPSPDLYLISLLTVGVLMTIRDVRKGGPAKLVEHPFLKTVQRIALFFVPVVLLGIPCAILIPGALSYAGTGFLSTITSFGGGEAYLTVAEGLFVNTGVVSTGTFYGQLVPVANALPGPILIKILCGIGFILGLETTGIPGAILLSMLGFFTAIAASCSIALLVQYLYRRFRDIPVLKMIRRWILPVVCGLLVITMSTMVAEASNIMTHHGVSPIAALLIMAGIFFSITLMKKAPKVTDILMILSAGGFSVLLMNLIGT